MAKTFAVCIESKEDVYWGYYRLKASTNIEYCIERAMRHVMKTRGEWDAWMEHYREQCSKNERRASDTAVPPYTVCHIPKYHHDHPHRSNRHLPIDTSIYSWSTQLYKIMSPGDLLVVNYQFPKPSVSIE